MVPCYAYSLKHDLDIYENDKFQKYVNNKTLVSTALALQSGPINGCLYFRYMCSLASETTLKF